MSQSQTTGKQIVSKRKYVTALGNKTVLSSCGISILFIGLSGLLGVCLVTALLFVTRPTVDTLLLLTVFIGIVGGGSCTIIHVGVCSIKEAKQIEAGIPFTRANTAHLSAPESLVRASQEPMQEQQTVLLRAAQGHGTPPDQLVRPAVGQDQEGSFTR